MAGNNLSAGAVVVSSGALIGTMARLSATPVISPTQPDRECPIVPFDVELIPSYGELKTEHAVLGIKCPELRCLERANTEDSAVYHKVIKVIGEGAEASVTVPVNPEEWYDNFARNHPGVWTVIGPAFTEYGHPALLCGQKGKPLTKFPAQWVRFVGLSSKQEEAACSQSETK